MRFKAAVVLEELAILAEARVRAALTFTAECRVMGCDSSFPGVFASHGGSQKMYISVETGWERDGRELWQLGHGLVTLTLLDQKPHQLFLPSKPVSLCRKRALWAACWVSLQTAA
jgi:hypothetical protein